MPSSFESSFLPVCPTVIPTAKGSGEIYIVLDILHYNKAALEAVIHEAALRPLKAVGIYLGNRYVTEFVRVVGIILTDSIQAPDLGVCSPRPMFYISVTPLTHDYRVHRRRERPAAKCYLRRVPWLCVFCVPHTDCVPSARFMGLFFTCYLV